VMEVTQTRYTPSPCHELASSFPGSYITSSHNPALSFVLGPSYLRTQISTAVSIDPNWRGSSGYALAALVQEGVDSDSGEKAVVVTFTN